MAEIRLVVLSDLHLWRLPRHPREMLGKRIFGLANLAASRWRKHRKPELQSVIQQALALNPNHAIIAGDITFTGLREEFDDAATVLKPLLDLPGGATVIPGNHDRYSREVVQQALFENTSASISAEPSARRSPTRASAKSNRWQDFPA